MDPESTFAEIRAAAKAMVEKYSDEAPKQKPITKSSNKGPVINKSPAPPPAPVLTKAEEENPTSYPNREALIDKILLLQKNISLPAGAKAISKTSLLNKKRDELERLLADMFNRAHEVTQTPIPEEKFEVVKNQQGETIGLTKLPELINDNAAASALYSLNYTLVKCLELASVNLDMKGKTGSDLEGLSDDIQERRAELQEIMAAIMKDHGPAIKPFLTPAARYAAFMASTTTQRFAYNRKKNIDSQSHTGSSSTTS